MIRRWLALTYYLYALSHFYFNPLYKRFKINAKKQPALWFSECRLLLKGDLQDVCRSTTVPAIHHAGKIAAAQIIGMDEQVADTGIAPHGVFVIAVELHQLHVFAECGH